MMQKFASILLPLQTAVRYFDEVLTAGGATKIPTDTEPAYAIAPEGTSTARLLNFAMGGLLLPMPKITDGRTSIQPTSTTVSTASSIVSEEAAHCQQPALWIHEPLLTEEEIVLQGLPYEILDRKIYLVFDTNLDEVRISQLIRYSLLSWHFLAFVTEGRRQIRSVDELMVDARLILLGAYDGESFLYKRIRR